MSGRSDELVSEEAGEQPQAPVEGIPPVGTALLTRARGVYRVVGPVGTTVLAFFLGGLVVLVTGDNPLRVYHAIFNGTGLNWLFHFGSYSIRVPFTTHHVWFWWDTGSVAAFNLQQTLLLTTPIVLTGLAVAFAFRVGLFNIGGQGQYFVGAYVAVWIGSSFAHLQPLVHVLLAVVVATLAGAAYGSIPGLLKATTGAHEVITTIMLNWIAFWVGSYLFGQAGPLQISTQSGVPESNVVVAGAKLPVFWGPKELQGLSIGVFVALAMLVVYWVVVRRTTLGFEIRAVGFNPEAARTSGISVTRNYVLAMAIAGGFAGLAGVCDILGWQFQIGPSEIQASQIGFIGLAAALLGRNSAVGVGFASLLFGALINGTSGRQLDSSIFPPELAGNLTIVIQGLVVLFVGLDLAGVLGGLRRRRRST
ncbi:MAG TPA: ABC transporter permease [Gaiellaceae bacterium]|nr:ABC transporter permease [Gaiellaceae bacterium]